MKLIEKKEKSFLRKESALKTNLKKLFKKIELKTVKKDH